MILFAKAVGLEVSLASFRKLEDIPLKAKFFGGRSGDVDKVSRRPLFTGRDGSVVPAKEVSRSVYSLPTFIESVESKQVIDVGSQEPCSSRQADESLSSAPTAYSWNGTDSLKTLKETQVDMKKISSNPVRWSREGRPRRILGSGGDNGGFVFTEKMVALAPFAKSSLLGPRIHFKISIVSFVCSVKRKFVTDLGAL